MFVTPSDEDPCTKRRARQVQIHTQVQVQRQVHTEGRLETFKHKPNAYKQAHLLGLFDGLDKLDGDGHLHLHLLDDFFLDLTASRRYYGPMGHAGEMR